MSYLDYGGYVSVFGGGFYEGVRIGHDYDAMMGFLIGVVMEYGDYVAMFCWKFWISLIFMVLIVFYSLMV